MGNRAVIAFAPYRESNVGIYVHWNGGRASIKGFLEAGKALGFRDPCVDNYGIARLVQIIGTYLGNDGGLSLGVDLIKRLDTQNGDNGVYIVGPGWEIVDRKFAPNGEEIDEDKTAAIRDEIVRKIRPPAPVEEEA